MDQGFDPTETDDVRWESQTVLVDGFLGSHAGQAVLHRYSSRYNLPESYEDDVRERVLLRTRRYIAQGNIIDNIEAWVSTCVRNQCLDMLKSTRVRTSAPMRSRSEGESTEIDFGGSTDTGLEAIPTGLDRPHLHEAVVQSATEGWLAAYAFTLFAVTLDGATPGRECPSPAGGASQAERVRWTALWYAGRHHCFDSADGTATAIRARRSRDGGHATAFLRSVIRDAGWSEA